MIEARKIMFDNFCELPSDYYDNIKKYAIEMGLNFTDDEIKSRSIEIQNMYDSSDCVARTQHQLQNRVLQSSW